MTIAQPGGHEGASRESSRAAIGSLSRSFAMTWCCRSQLATGTGPLSTAAWSSRIAAHAAHAAHARREIHVAVVRLHFVEHMLRGGNAAAIELHRVAVLDVERFAAVPSLGNSQIPAQDTGGPEDALIQAIVGQRRLGIVRAAPTAAAFAA